MSSDDYIARLRSELLRAGATKQSRRPSARTTRRLRPLTVGIAAALVVAAIVLAVPGQRSDDTAVEPAATARLSYRVAPGVSEQSEQILRTRLAAAGINPAFVSGSGGTLTIAVTPADRAAADALLAPGRLAMYDWEGSVLGPDGKTAPSDEAVTGGPDAGRAAALSEADARARAATRPEARVVQSENGSGWFALAGAPALTNAELAGARAAEDPAVQEPIVALEFTTQGQNAFRELTRDVARSGANYAGPDADGIMDAHHFVIVVDDRIISVPYINWQMNPDGIDGAQGTHISTVGLTTETARQLAAILSAGPLPAPVQP